jgi:hypothetical protein
VGLLVSREKTATHHPQAEYMESGLAGICPGVSALPHERRKVEGVARQYSIKMAPENASL